ncbi:hypothetical protein QC762_0085430 [Podospora pseudocomata]|uniref:Uncharacterized protein n=1 Tax=Podospora pseudocomata TaxID=2093779 RepID=A0ABR0GCX0_9PEZI|nr:hypothetical protein QC762_0085430 [Podospora pseudocomata]
MVDWHSLSDPAVKRKQSGGGGVTAAGEVLTRKQQSGEELYSEKCASGRGYPLIAMFSYQLMV